MFKQIAHFSIFSTLLCFAFCSSPTTPKVGDEPHESYTKAKYDSCVIVDSVAIGRAKSYSGNLVHLMATLYEPYQSKSKSRPLVILAPGGGFVSLDFASMDVLARKLTKHGYVVAITQYRLFDGELPMDEVESAAALIHAREDLIKAILVLKNTVNKDNPHRINPFNVFIGGHSAGALTCLHTAFLQDFEITDSSIYQLYQKYSEEKIFANLDAAFDLKGVINMSGAMLDTVYLQGGKAALLSLHGTNDEVVPHNRSMAFLPDIIDSTLMCGSEILHQRAENLGIKSELKLIEGGNHDAPVDPQVCPDCFQAIVDFLAKHVNN